MNFKDYIKNFGVMFFDDKKLSIIKKNVRIKTTIFAIVTAIALQSAPVRISEIKYFPQFFFLFLSKYLLILSMIFVMTKILGSKVKAEKFFGTVSIIYLLAMVLTTFLAYLSIIIFENLFSIRVVSRFITSILPFYMVLLFGWSCDCASELKGMNKWIIGLIAIIFFYLIYNYLFIII